MQRLEFSGAVRPLEGSLGLKGLTGILFILIPFTLIWLPVPEQCAYRKIAMSLEIIVINRIMSLAARSHIKFLLVS